MHPVAPGSTLASNSGAVDPLDTIGPVDFLVVEYPHGRMSGEAFLYGRLRWLLASRAGRLAKTQDRGADEEHECHRQHRDLGPQLAERLQDAGEGPEQLARCLKGGGRAHLLRLDS